MKDIRNFTLTVFMFCCLALVSTAWAETGTITNINGNKITVKFDAGRGTTLVTEDTRGLKVGDKVSIEFGKLTKVADIPLPIPRQTEPLIKPSGDKVADLPIPIPKPQPGMLTTQPGPPNPGGKVSDLPIPLP